MYCTDCTALHVSVVCTAAIDTSLGPIVIPPVAYILPDID